MDFKDVKLEQQKIGKVDFYATKESIEEKRYSDGDIENKILDFFRVPKDRNEISEVLDGNPTWAEIYHYTPVRENLLSWFDFEKNKSLLEIGSGAGALTGLFCRRLSSVLAVELTYRRAQITAHRHQTMDNLTVVSSDVNSLRDEATFDYVTSIGVLEYAGAFSDSRTPFLDFAKTMFERLNQGGKAIVAIENKFGLKYWGGCREDHTGRLFDSIEGYTDQKERQTFSKLELSSLMMDAGFSEVEFYYPLPDYKLPTEIFSDRYLPSIEHLPRTSHYPFKDYGSRPEEKIFDHRLVMDQIINNQQFDFFANSFLAIAHKK